MISFWRTPIHAHYILFSSCRDSPAVGLKTSVCLKYPTCWSRYTVLFTPPPIIFTGQKRKKPTWSMFLCCVHSKTNLVCHTGRSVHFGLTPIFHSVNHDLLMLRWNSARFLLASPSFVLSCFYCCPWIQPFKVILRSSTSIVMNGSAAHLLFDWKIPQTFVFHLASHRSIPLLEVVAFRQNQVRLSSVM